jgi:hypothetical protein
MAYFIQDTLYVALSIFLLFFLLGYMALRRRFPKGSPLLFALILLFSCAGLSDLAFRFSPNPVIVLYADSLNLFCFVFSLAILSHFSLLHFSKNPLWTHTKSYLLLYLPALIIAALHILSPLMISGIISGPIGFQLNYNWGYWLIVIYAALFGFHSIALNLIIIVKNPLAAEKNHSIFLLLVLLLSLYFYNSSLILPFLYRMVNFASPLPTTFAVLILTYTFIRYNYFTLEFLKPEGSTK